MCVFIKRGVDVHGCARRLYSPQSCYAADGADVTEEVDRRKVWVVCVCVLFCTLR